MVRCDTWEGGFNLYLPEIDQEDIENAVSDLKLKNDLRVVEEKLQFRAFPSYPFVTPDEDSHFKPLVAICEDLRNRSLKTKKAASCKLVQKSKATNTAETPGANFKTDAALILLNSTMPSDSPLKTIPLADVAVPMEFKKNSPDFLDNRRKLLSAMIFSMNDDPRRMHVYGITIENTEMIVWYCSRSHSARSPALDFSKEPREFIRIMLSLLFADEKQLGYDPTVHRRIRSEELCFVYEVGERCFRTQGVIYDHRSLCPTGRATRVWKVVQVGSPDDLEPIDKSVMALKDVWLDSQSTTEGQNLDSILDRLKKIAESLEKSEESAEREKKAALDLFDGLDSKSKEKLQSCLKDRAWKQYFLTKVCDWQGSVSKEVPTGAWPDSTLFDPRPSTVTASSHPQADPSRSRLTGPTSLAPAAPRPPSRSYRPKRQYRVVYKEVCEALDVVKKLDVVASALCDCVFALQLMFLAGWVHRDISSGNVLALVSQETGSDTPRVRGILGDLEFAKFFDPTRAIGGSDPKTGTAYFMAVEIQSQLLFYHPERSMPLPKSARQSLPPSVQANRITELESTPPTGVIHNHEHDMESVFWLLLWTVLARVPCDRNDPRKPQVESYVSGIFQNTSTCPLMRAKVFKEPALFPALLKNSLHPDLQRMSDSFLKLREALWYGYIHRKHNFGDRSSYAELYEYIYDVLDDCYRAIQAKPTFPLLLSHGSSRRLTAGATGKRGHQEIEGEEGQESAKASRGELSTDATSSRTEDRDT